MIFTKNHYLCMQNKDTPISSNNQLKHDSSKKFIRV